MARLTEKFGFVVSPRFDCALGMLGNRTTTSALEMCFFGLTLGQELANKGQDNNTHKDNRNDEFR